MLTLIEIREDVRRVLALLEGDDGEEEKMDA
jgi:hypothetical protein